jgi:hypothetical protein
MWRHGCVHSLIVNFRAKSQSMTVNTAVAVNSAVFSTALLLACEDADERDKGFE